jgi:hypothetical protein
MTQVPVIEKAYLIDLHGRLSVLHDLLARRAIPHSYTAPGCEEVKELMEFIEELTEQQPI